MMGSNHYGTISEVDIKGKYSNKLSGRNKNTSEGFYEGNVKPPRLVKKIRPYSAPRGHG